MLAQKRWRCRNCPTTQNYSSARATRRARACAPLEAFGDAVQHLVLRAALRRPRVCAYATCMCAYAHRRVSEPP
eukprot:scaffold20775_cov109-Isochrysis_galbana.AAC.4